MDITALDVARSFTGTHERAGTLDNPQVLAWLELCSIEDPHDEVPWCSAFVNGVIRLFDGHVPRSKSAAARSWLNVGTRVSLMEARPGWDVVIFKRGDGAQPGVDVLQAPGHVAFFVAQRDDRVVVLGGNQADSVGLSAFPVDRVLAVQRLYEE